MSLPRSSFTIVGITGVDHADPGVCPRHSSVMLAPGEPCAVCHQEILIRSLRIGALPMPAPRPSIPSDEVPASPSQVGMSMPHHGWLKTPLVFEPEGHLSPGDYV